MKNLGDKRQRWVKVRIGLLGALLLLGAGRVAVRAYQLQVSESPQLRERAEQNYQRTLRLAPKRGNIYDRHGAELAVSVLVDSISANPRELQKAGYDPNRAAEQIGQLIDIDESRIIQRLSSTRRFAWIKRHVTPQEGAAIRALEIPGLRLEREAKRYYPNRELAAHLLGFANIDGRGIEGLELAYDEQLKGSAQSVPAIRDNRGRLVYSERLLDDRADRGDDLTLTIDKTIQYIAERELRLAVQTFEAAAGSVVVMDPRTGEFLAVANYPTYNPNQPGRFPAASRRNRALTDRFEPGSTVKPFTVAGALAAGTIHAEQVIDCEGGALDVDEFTIHDSHPFDELTPAQILAFSSNIGTTKIGRSLGRRGLYRVFRRFGFGERLGLGLPGENAGSLSHFRRWYEMDAATIPFGQGMSTTAVQLAGAMSGLANQGRLMSPYIVRTVTTVSGETVEAHVPELRRRVVPSRTARLVADMLTAVTGPGGTGPEASIDGFLVAGKTGTAQKADFVHGGYTEDKWLASFVGFVPADRPRVVIAVAIDEPMIEHYGGVVAGPVFRRVGQAVLRHLGVPPDLGGDALAELRVQRRVAARRQREAAEAGELEVESGAEEGVEVATGDVPEGSVRVPDVVGKTTREALVTLASSGLGTQLAGSGIVHSQLPTAGAVVEEGERIRVIARLPTDTAPNPVPAGEPQTAQLTSVTERTEPAASPPVESP